MAIPKVDPFTKVPNTNDPVNFESDTDTFLSETNSRYLQGNSQVDAINQVATNIEQTEDNIEQIYQDILDKEPTSGGYSKESVNTKLAEVANADHPFNGYMDYAPIDDNFYFEESTNFVSKFADKNRFIKFPSGVVDTHLHSSYDSNIGGVVFDGFDFIPEVYVQDQATNGLITQQAVTKGDSVVVAREITNTSNLTWNENTNANGDFSVVGNKITLTGTTTPYRVYTSYSTVIGKKYTVKLKNLVYIDSTNVEVKLGSTTFGADYFFKANSTGLAEGDTVVTFTATSTVLYITLETGLNGSFSIDNTVVQILDETYRATRDTVDMFDYKTSDGTQTITETTVVYNDGANPNGAVGFWVRGLATTVDLAVANLNSFWTYLGTASNMSLENPYFEVRDDKPISNQIAVLHKQVDSSKAYNGLVGEVLINDALAIETPKAIMIKNGFTELEKGVYQKDGNNYVFVGIWQTLNKGAYHPFFNSSGTSKSTDALTDDWEKDWWQQTDNVELSTLFISGSNAVTGGNYSTGLVVSAKSGRPDGKFYDIIYKNQFRDCREYSFRPTQTQIKQSEEDLKFNGVEGFVATVEGIQKGSSLTRSNVYISKNTGNPLVGSSIYHNSQIALITEVIEEEFNYLCNLDRSINAILDGTILYSTAIPTLSSGNDLRTDLIGSPDNYPQIVKDRLAEGKPLFGINPLLVDDEGNSLIPDGVLKGNKAPKKILEMYQGLYSPNNGTNWSTSVSAFQLVENEFNYADFSTPIGGIRVLPYKKQNNPMSISDPLQVVNAEDRVTITNNHSIYKGAIFGNMIGKIQTNNSGDSIESKALENIVLSKSKYETTDGVFTINPNETILVTEVSASGKVGNVYKLLDPNPATLDWRVYTAFTNTLLWEDLGSDFSELVSVPKHSANSLDNSTSSASKFFKTLATDGDYLYSQVFMEELINNGDTGDFSQLSNGTKTDWNGATVKTLVANKCLGFRR